MQAPSCAGTVRCRLAIVMCAGTVVDGYPFQTSGKIVAPVTITRLADGPAQQLLVSCFDGFFYVIDGITVCAGDPT